MFAARYANNYDMFNQTKPYKKEISMVYQWAKKPFSIFDIGCGTASYWKHFPEHVHIVGVDRSPDMAHKNPNIIKADITKYEHKGERFDCALALFDVLNYIKAHDWWKNIPVKKGGYFIFDVWDKEKVERDGFKTTVKKVNGLTRVIKPQKYDGHVVDLKIEVFEFEDVSYNENHRMYVHSHEDIEKFCGKEFRIDEITRTESWQTFYRCVRK